MEQNNNKFIAVSYKLYTTDADGTQTMVEEAPAGKPFSFVSGFGVTLDGFEHAVADLAKGDTFDFVLTSDQAYGEYMEERVVDLDKNIFTVNGRFDHENIFEGAIVPLQNEHGQRFLARVAGISADKVKMDLNHPLAGKTLNFKGSVIENREATNDEIQTMLNHLSGEGCGSCGGGCGDCGGGCGGHDGGCGHCH